MRTGIRRGPLPADQLATCPECGAPHDGGRRGDRETCGRKCAAAKVKRIVAALPRKAGQRRKICGVKGAWRELEEA